MIVWHEGKCKIVVNKDSKIFCKGNIFKVLVFNKILLSLMPFLRTSVNMTHTALLRSQPPNSSATLSPGSVFSPQMN